MATEQWRTGPKATDARVNELIAFPHRATQEEVCRGFQELGDLRTAVRAYERYATDADKDIAAFKAVLAISQESIVEQQREVARLNALLERTGPRKSDAVKTAHDLEASLVGGG